MKTSTSPTTTRTPERASTAQDARIRGSLGRQQGAHEPARRRRASSAHPRLGLAGAHLQGHRGRKGELGSDAAVVRRHHSSPGDSAGRERGSRGQQLTQSSSLSTSSSRAQTIVHYGWIPTILFVAYRASNPRPPLMRCARRRPPRGSCLTPFSLARTGLSLLWLDPGTYYRNTLPLAMYSIPHFAHRSPAGL